MDFPRLKALNSYWRKSPPVHLSAHWIAKSRGMKSSDDDGGNPSEPSSTTTEAGDILDMLTFGKKQTAGSNG